MKGCKRFKIVEKMGSKLSPFKNRDKSPEMENIELEDLDVSEAKKLYRKLNTKSSYN